MALTNALLKSFGLEQEQRDMIMSEHQSTLESIKAERDELRDKAAQVPVLENRVQELEAQIPTEDWKAKYEAEKARADKAEADKAEYEEKVTAERAEEEKARLYRSMLREQGVAEKHIDSIMKVTDLGKLAVEDGAIADSEKVAEAIASEWEDFIPKTVTMGARVDNPPANVGGKPTKAEILAIKDTQARQRAIAENIDVFE